MGLGGFIIAGLIGIAIGSSASHSIPPSHRTCAYCGYRTSDIIKVGENSSFVKVRFHCNNCGRTWTKTYRVR